MVTRARKEDEAAKSVVLQIPRGKAHRRQRLEDKSGFIGAAIGVGVRIFEASGVFGQL